MAPLCRMLSAPFGSSGRMFFELLGDFLVIVCSMFAFSGSSRFN